MSAPLLLDFPQDEPLVTVVIGEKWLAYLQGVCYEMLNRWYWDNPTDEQWDVLQNKVALLMEMLAGNMEVGTIKLHILENAPSNWLPMTGQNNLLRVNYPRLYSAVNPNFIIDADTFSLPDMSDQFIKIAATPAKLGELGGSPTTTIGIENLPAHTHAANTGNEGTHFFIGQSNNGNQNPQTTLDVTVSALETRISAFSATASTGGGEPIERDPSYVTLGMLIVAS